MKTEEISKLYKEFHVPAHVMAHMKQVSVVCEILADAFIEKGIKIDKEDLVKAALVHDVLRVCDFLEFNPEKFPNKFTEEDERMWKELREKYGEIEHIKGMVKILDERGERNIGKLVEKHGFFEIDNLNSWEEKIIYYADKRVDGAEVVALDKRFSEGRKRNLKDDEINGLLLVTEIKVKNLEKEFIEALGVLPI